MAFRRALGIQVSTWGVSVVETPLNSIPSTEGEPMRRFSVAFSQSVPLTHIVAGESYIVGVAIGFSNLTEGDVRFNRYVRLAYADENVTHVYSMDSDEELVSDGVWTWHFAELNTYDPLIASNTVDRYIGIGNMVIRLHYGESTQKWVFYASTQAQGVTATNWESSVQDTITWQYHNINIMSMSELVGAIGLAANEGYNEARSAWQRTVDLNTRVSTLEEVVGVADVSSRFVGR